MKKSKELKEIEFKDEKDELDELLKKKARDIKNDSHIYNLPNYNISRIREDIREASAMDKLNDEEIEVRKKLLKEDPRKTISTVTPLKNEFLSLMKLANSLLGKKIVPSEPISDLINDSLLQNWVRDGINHHKGKRDCCGFCGNIIDEYLWGKLDKHFNRESEDLRIKIDLCINRLSELKDKIFNYIKIDINDFYVDLQPEYKKAEENYKVVKESYINCISSLILELKERANDIFNERTAINYIDYTEAFNVEIENINELIDKNNQRTNNLGKDQHKVRIELLKDKVERFVELIEYEKRIEKITKLEDEVKELANLISVNEQEVNRVKMEIERLEEELKDESRGAELVNNYLSSFFGHKALELKAEGEKPNINFKILRDGVEAKNLSEGECSLIAFCYFIAQIEDDLKAENSKDGLIIFIDDPISSLDGNHIYFMFSLIESVIAKKKNYHQLFISTHSMDFLKYLKRLTKPNRQDINYFLIERRMWNDTSRSFLIKMPNHIRDYVTEFNYLFSELYSVHKEMEGNYKKKVEHTYSKFYNLPNNIRKFLECYLFYKYPNNDSPLDNLYKLFDDDEIPVLVNRVINEYSHLAYLDRGWKPIDVEEIEKCVRIIIDRIREKDPDQFNALLESIGRKKDIVNS
ncbi:AAA family ATPase [Hazenella coriacea]|uniref:Wobble nucleotide-excising tRNase n=1 Tax=Hazenella coriacea TaxID=1179467 RepID=A0A4V2UUV9_9BACL|nr:AAA family ATPase [Hazenella coriacea]TCS93307.1 wobble nucleotide-excising tRNase [Hazenella coriacea]